MSVQKLPGVLTVSEAAKHAKVSERTMRKEIAEGRLRARRIGRCVRILEEELARWLREGVDPQD